VPIEEDAKEDVKYTFSTNPDEVLSVHIETESGERYNL
jgi:hypothetical protein